MTRSADQAPTADAARRLAAPRLASVTATPPASSVAAEDGSVAGQYADRTKYPSQPALLTEVSVAHAHETPAVSPVARSRRICGRY
jgi:hypothetical protein